MDSDEGLCPSIPLTDDLEVSTPDRSVGTHVQFMCSGAGFELVGPKVLYCNPDKTWNGTAPYCNSVEDFYEPTSSANVTYTEGPGDVDVSSPGFQVNTVVIILWSAGGCLLLTLIIMMACILRSHKKGRRAINRSNLFPGRQPRHGGVNPTFTSYDEIWTWIPVVTESQNNCTSQIYPSARESSSANGANISTLTLPSYENAVRQSASSVPRNNAQIVANPRARNNDNHYETIPADLNQNHPSASGGATPASASRPSNSLSALTAALQSPLSERRAEPATRVSAQRVNNSGNRERENTRTGTSQSSHVNQIRQQSQNMYRQYNSRNQSQRVVAVNPGFTHSDRSMFSYYSETGRRIYCDIPPCLIDEDAPPPYNNNNYQSQNGNRPTASAPVMRLEYDYF